MPRSVEKDVTSSHLVVVLLLCQTEQPCHQKVYFFRTGRSKCLIFGDINVLRQQIDDIKIVDILDKVCHQSGPLNTEQIGQFDIDKALERGCTVNSGCFQHIAGNVHQNAGSNQHLIRHADPDVDENDHELGPMLVSQERNMVHILAQQTDSFEKVGHTDIRHHGIEDTGIREEISHQQ